MKSIFVDVEKLDSIANKKAKRKLSVRTFFRPQASAIIPQKCNVSTMPIKLTEFSKPCSESVIFKSHFAAGAIKHMFSPSMKQKTIESAKKHNIQ